MKLCVPPKYDPKLNTGREYAPPGQYSARVLDLWIDTAPSGAPALRLACHVMRPPRYLGFHARGYWVISEPKNGEYDTSTGRAMNVLVAMGLGGEEIEFTIPAMRMLADRVRDRILNITVEKGKGSFSMISRAAPATA
jgi:hypothetical protein